MLQKTQQQRDVSLPLGKIRKSVSILGSTGSVGENTLNLIDHAVTRQDAEITIVALTAATNVTDLAKQAHKYKPQFVAIADEARHDELKSLLKDTGIKTGAGPAALIEAAAYEADWVMAAIVGAAGLPPVLAAARRGADIAFANKECLVCAGELMLQEVKRGGGVLLPVDSEHNAIFQVYDFERPERITRLLLTASGGPFYNASLEEMANVTPAQAVAHPNWSMGAKISVDSATMMNKGLELIEAARLFPTPEEQIEILVHPQSVVHSMVEYVDGSVLAQLGTPDMRTPIAYALGWPDRVESPSEKLDFSSLSKLEFLQPDEARFPALRVARDVLKTDGLAPAVLNAANEVAVAAFLNGHLKFLDIVAVCEGVLSDASSHIGSLGRASFSLEEMFEADRVARNLASDRIAKLAE
jgi:1-deoxy-D-xylulose-5-phosphate reductoisomerase